MSVAKRNGGRPQNVVVYEERGNGRYSREVSCRNSRVDDNTGCMSYHGVTANERVKINKKSASARQTVNETSRYYSPEDSSLLTQQHLVSRQANFTNYKGKPKHTVKTYDLYKTQYESPEESWSVSQSKATVSNGRKTKMIEQRQYDDNAGRSIDFHGGSSKRAGRCIENKGGSSKNNSRAVSRYGGHNSNWDYEGERNYVDSHLDDVFSSLSLR